LRVVKVMWMGEPASGEKVEASSALRVALVLSCLGILLFGLIPGIGMNLAGLARIIGF
jgi:NADH:ubiquinone oxidoreductase subunit 2 (subunit N)